MGKCSCLPVFLPQPISLDDCFVQAAIALVKELFVPFFAKLALLMSSAEVVQSPSQEDRRLKNISVGRSIGAFVLQKSADHTLTAEGGGFSLMVQSLLWAFHVDWQGFPLKGKVKGEVRHQVHSCLSTTVVFRYYHNRCSLVSEHQSQDHSCCRLSSIKDRSWIGIGEDRRRRWKIPLNRCFSWNVQRSDSGSQSLLFYFFSSFSHNHHCIVSQGFF